MEKSAADTHGLFEWRMLADVFQSFPPRKFRQSAADPPCSEADSRGTYLVRRVRGGFRVGNFYSAKKNFCRIPPRRRSDILGPTRTQADSIGVRRGIVPPFILPNFELEQNLDHHFHAKFHSDSDGDSFKAQKPIIDLLIGLN